MLLAEERGTYGKETMDVLEDPEELGRRISAVRGYLQMQRPEFAELLEISVPTLRRWEEGDEASLGRSVNVRREKANRVLNVAEVPEQIMGIVSFRLEDRLGELERKFELLARLAEGAE